MRPLPKGEGAERFARALQNTTDRYLAGYMARSTWGTHMYALWRQAERAGLRNDVMRLVDPLAKREQFLNR